MSLSRLGIGAAAIFSVPLSVVACTSRNAVDRTPPNPSNTVTPGAKSSGPTIAAPASATAGTSADVPMDWGTRPTGDGPLYAIADGMCVVAQIHPIDNGAIFTCGNGEYLNCETSFPTASTSTRLDS